MYDLRLTDHLSPANFALPNPSSQCALDATLAAIKAAVALCPYSGREVAEGGDGTFEWLDPDFQNE